MHCFEPDYSRVPLGLDEADAAEEHILARGDCVDAAVFRWDRVPGFGSHRFEQLANQMLEFGGRQLEQIWPRVESGDNIKTIHKTEALQVEGDEWFHGFQVKRVRRHKGVKTF